MNVPQKSKARKRRGMKYMLLILPFMAILFIFSYYPLYGWRYAFYDFRPPKSLSDCEFVGFKWFVTLVSNSTKRAQVLQVLKNTFVMSGLDLITSWLPMMFAIFLSELRNKRFSKLVQTLTTIPNFVSWVLVYSLAFALFSNSGMMNSLLMKLGVIENPILFLQDSQHTYLTMWLWLTWKTLGWCAIMYLAAISGIDQELYEAARVDGANRFQLIRHITIPGLLPTFFVLLMMSIANFLNNGMDQYYVFQNSFNSDKIEVLDLYVYNLGISGGSYSMGTAVSIFKSVISVTLLMVTNRLSKAFRGESIF